MDKNIIPPQDKRNFGMLQQFDDLIIFAHGNMNNKSGAFIDYDPVVMRKVVVKCLKDFPELKELFKNAVNEAYGIIVVP